MGTRRASDEIRLTVPAEVDYVSVLRVATRVVAGRAGFDDDGRSRLLAAAGAAFFALVRDAAATGSVTSLMRTSRHRVVLELSASSANPLDPDAVVDIGDGHELLDGARTLRFWVDR